MPYDDIDKELIEILDVLNFKLHLRTSHCCFGNDLEQGLIVGFHECVQDKDIMKMANFLQDKIIIRFYKVVTNTDRILISLSCLISNRLINFVLEIYRAVVVLLNFRNKIDLIY